MKEMSMPQRGLAQAARGVARSEWVERVARLGFAAKGTVYVLVGVLAAGAAFSAARAEGSEGAMQSLHEQPFGRILLAVIALGLLGYALWRALSAIANAEHEPVPKRIGHFAKGTLYIGVAAEAGRIALAATANGGGEERAVHWTAEVMSRPFGTWAVAITGAIIAGYGVYQIYKALKGQVTKHLDLRSMSSTAMKWTTRFGQIGIGARGVVLVLVGIFLVQAALRSDPTEARGLGGALRTVEQQPYGPWLLAVMAVGVFAYGLFQFVHAKCRRINVPV